MFFSSSKEAQNHPTWDAFVEYIKDVVGEEIITNSNYWYPHWQTWEAAIKYAGFLAMIGFRDSFLGTDSDKKEVMSKWLESMNREE